MSIAVGIICLNNCTEIINGEINKIICKVERGLNKGKRNSSIYMHTVSYLFGTSFTTNIILNMYVLVHYISEIT